MKKAIIIVAAVAAYCLFEIVLLLSIVTPNPGYPTSGTRQTVTGAAQLVLIPGLAAVFSRIIYGPYRWKRRALIILAVGAGCVPALVGLVAVGMVLDWVSSRSIAWLIVLLVLIGCGFIPALFFVVRKLRKRGVALETKRWLAERQSGTSARERRWKDRAIRYSLWLPALSVLLVFLFLPESWGIASHFEFRTQVLTEYQVRVPASWIILQQDAQSEPGYSYISGLAGRGMGFSVTRYLHWWDVPLSSWSVGTQPYAYFGASAPEHWLPKIENVIAQRDFLIGNTPLTCVDYWPSYLTERGKPRDASIAYINCYSPARLYASFTGERFQVPVFYKMLEGITQTR
ncbi:MAG TPA: hypothetical protein VK738_11750 [Terriglobales bacterium]|jgi:MFS family permease|nr:hypothetical protein [Terriglobales bacterium]